MPDDITNVVEQTSPPEAEICSHYPEFWSLFKPEDSLPYSQ